MASDESLHEVVVAGDRVRSLRALRDRLATELDVCGSARDVAALSQRLMDVLEQIALVEAAKPATEGTALDELASRRSAAGRPDASGTTGSTRAAKRR